ncbi:MAG: N-formylglutamate amidohydrolase [Polyangiales bacterium]
MFRLRHPTRSAIPVIVEVPHAGLVVPSEVENEIFTNREMVLRDSDLFVDEIFERATELGATSLFADVARHVVDLNRSEHDIDARAVPEHPNAVGANATRGVVWAHTSNGERLLRRPLRIAQFERRIELYYRPYHACLRNEIDRLVAEWGFVIVLAAHSMPSTGVSRNGTVRRPDVIPGTRDGRSSGSQVIDTVDACLRGTSIVRGA